MATPSSLSLLARRCLSLRIQNLVIELAHATLRAARDRTHRPPVPIPAYRIPAPRARIPDTGPLASPARNCGGEPPPPRQARRSRFPVSYRPESQNFLRSLRSRTVNRSKFSSLAALACVAPDHIWRMCIEETAGAPRKAASRDIHFGTIFKIGGKYPNLAIIGLNSPKHLRFLIHAQDTTHPRPVGYRIPASNSR